jgi:hypothetical protein
MDDKSINLWRQIESCRRRNRKIANAIPTAAVPPRPANTN